MSNPLIRLVFSKEGAGQLVNSRLEWSLEAEQLSLFSENEGVKVVLVALSQTSAHYFNKVLDEKSPSVMIDLRDFPDFFSIYSSREQALDDFNRRGIEYARVSIGIGSEADRWKAMDVLKSKIKDSSDKSFGSSIFLLTSTKASLERVSSKIKGYISQEINVTKFEEVVGP